MKKKNLALISAAALILGTLAACGGSSSTSTTAAANADTKADSKADSASETKASGDLEKITVAASPTPHAEILEQAREPLKEKGYDLEIKEFEDYVQPNLVVSQGQMDANYFQHILYLTNFNEEKGTDLVSAGKIHYEPFGIYPGTKASLDDLADGDHIAVPNDTTNEARALLLLQDQGLITLKDGVGLGATKNDITDYPKGKIEITELEAAQIPQHTKDCAFLVMNGNYALEAGFTVSKDALATEDSSSQAVQDNYVNVIAVKSGNENEDKIKALVEVLKSDTISEYIKSTYNGAVVPYEGE